MAGTTIFVVYIDRTGWPHQKNFVDEDGAFDCEVRSVSTLATVEESVDDKVYGLDRITDASRYSSLKTLLIVTCFVIRFKNNLLAKLKKKDFIKGQIDIKGFNKAEKLWIISEQKYLSNENFKQLKNNLDLFYDDLKILRLKRRFGNSSLLDDQKYPVLLRTFSHFTYLVVLNAHEKVLHGGLRITLNHIRGKFCICQSRRVVNKVLQRCVVCKRSEGRTMKGLPPPELTVYRLSFDYAFSYTGIDFAGPLYVKNVYSDDKDEMFKCYICLLTCATTCNVHLELSSNMDSSKVISCLKRFLSRRGCLNLFISDNFSAFKLNEVVNFLRLNDINWEYILSLSPCWGGFKSLWLELSKVPLEKFWVMPN